ncbi:polysaccharide biosynthesis protein [Pedobacter sp. MC2016-05]|uniref:polysaccharide biosynthesis protein n=1 Tax=Pedobacter sp. MC2016-05 TaxID=2994474 RepID=UPI002246C7B6|nr:polysaccharide biosynthesis protein [Pedobacter sp. MC2016-05]MCX2473289.1 polysaccharide biosynthesis protein [Pedobacter sp. MC2016-05]
MNYSDNEAIGVLYDRIWQLSPDYENPESFDALTLLTTELIEAYQATGRLDSDPFLSTQDRILSIQEDKLNEKLSGQICLVTGGSGCVGSCLVEMLLKFDIESVIVFDKKPFDNPLMHDDRLVFIEGNICDELGLKSCFDHYLPNFVFHTAAQRSPGYAENNVVEAIMDNVFGTLNVVRACEETSSVKQCVFSSTGKASRYFTSEVYAATKKLCEFILDAHSKNSHVLYSMVRFTHILDNSLMNIEFKDVDNADHFSIHSPGKYVTAQNVSEASCLMLNALIHAQPDKSVFLIVKNLEWPVESLEVALYNILKNRKQIPVTFKGNPLGYREGFFRGQLDWAEPHELNLLINVYENRGKKVNDEEDIIISGILPVSKQLLLTRLAEFKWSENESAARKWLMQTLKTCVADSLKNVDSRDTLNILKWGLDPNHPDFDEIHDDNFREIINLLTHTLIGTEEYKLVEKIIGGSKYELNTH